MTCTVYIVCRMQCCAVSGFRIRMNYARWMGVNMTSKTNLDDVNISLSWLVLSWVVLVVWTTARHSRLHCTTWVRREWSEAVRPPALGEISSRRWSGQGEHRTEEFHRNPSSLVLYCIRLVTIFIRDERRVPSQWPHLRSRTENY